MLVDFQEEEKVQRDKDQNMFMKVICWWNFGNSGMDWNGKTSRTRKEGTANAV